MGTDADFIVLDVQPEAEMPIRDIYIKLNQGGGTAVVHCPHDQRRRAQPG